jgi:hypothetical protein
VSHLSSAWRRACQLNAQDLFACYHLYFLLPSWKSGPRQSLQSPGTPQEATLVQCSQHLPHFAGVPGLGGGGSRVARSASCRQGVSQKSSPGHLGHSLTTGWR